VVRPDRATVDAVPDDSYTDHCARRSGVRRRDPGAGGLPRLVVDGPEASAEIYLQGAHVTSWVPRGEDPVLWMSARSAFTPGVPLRGGVPLCFPWFGADPAGGPQHGFARTADWALLDAHESGAEVVLTLGLSDSPASRSSTRSGRSALLRAPWRSSNGMMWSASQRPLRIIRFNPHRASSFCLCMARERFSSI